MEDTMEEFEVAQEEEAVEQPFILESIQSEAVLEANRRLHPSTRIPA